MNIKSSIKNKIMVGLIPLVFITMFTSIITISEKQFNTDLSSWLDGSYERKRDASELKYLLLKLLSKKQITQRKATIKDIQRHIENIDEFYKRDFFSQSLIYRIFLDQQFLASNTKSKQQWNENVKASIELAIELDKDEIDSELTTNILDFLDKFSSLVDTENQSQYQTLSNVRARIEIMIIIFDTALFAIVVLIYMQGVKIGNRVKELTSNILTLEAGERDTLPLISGRDELYELNITYNKIRASLNATTVSKNFFENVMGAMTDALVVVDINGAIKHFNNTTISLFGFDEQEILQKKFHELLVTNEIQLENEKLQNQRNDLNWINLGLLNYQKDTSGEKIINHEIMVKNKEDKHIPCLLSGSFLIEENNELSSYVLVLKDISELKEYEQELENERSKTVQAGKMATLGEMAGGVAHEINNPLATIDGLAKRLKIVMKKDPIPVEKVNSSIEKIEKHVERIAKIVKGLRSFSRDGSKDPFENVDLESVVKDSLELCNERIKTKGIKLIGFDNFDGFPTITGQQIPLTQVFVNLLNNSYDAILELDDKWIKLDGEEKEDSFKISITDSGPGIPAEIREKILQPFFTTKPIGVGTGLGLGIIVGILEKHGGKISVDADCPNTRFVIKLPKRFEPSSLKAS